MNNKQLAKKIVECYWANQQHLIIDTMELIQNNDRDSSFDVYMNDKEKTELFTIQNYNVFLDLDCMYFNRFREKERNIVQTWDGVAASCAPFFITRPWNTFTLPKFTQITKDDMVFATQYLCTKIFGMWRIFNIAFAEEEKK